MNDRLKILSLAILSQTGFSLRKMSSIPSLNVIENSKIIKELKENLDNISSHINENGGSVDLFDEFMDLNSMNFIEWSPVRSIGTGSVGEAFLMEDGRVLKITSLKDEVETREKLMMKLHNNDSDINQLMIYDIGKLDMPEIQSEYMHDFNLYYSITEKVDIDLYDKQENKFVPMNEIKNDQFDNIIKIVLREAIKFMNLNYNDSYKEDEDIISDDEILSIKENIIESIIKRFGNSFDSIMNEFERKYDLKNNWLDSLVTLCVKNYINNMGDLHIENLGIRNGEFVFFDF
jgi:hypothetical protein